jgi:hypothetical protein
MSNEFGAKITHSLTRSKQRSTYQSELQLEGVVGQQLGVSDLAHFARISTTQQVELKYLDRRMKRNMRLRFYGGYNLLYNPGSTYYTSMGRYAISMFGSAGYQDLFAENYYFNRATVSGYQYNDDMGGFRTASDNLRMSNYWAASVNATLQIPVKPNIFVAFADFGIYDNGIKAATLYNAGLGINLADVVGIYFPLVQSVNMGNLYTQYLNNVRLSLKFNPFNLPFKINNLINR